MASADVSALVDSLSVVDPVPAEVPETDPVETEEVPDTETESPDAATEGSEDETPQPDGSDGEKPVDGRTNPAAIRSALKAFRDASPENAAAARQLNDAYGRWAAAKTVFPGGVSEMKATRAILDAVGGSEGLTGLQDTIRSVNETDAALYAGDGKVIQSLYDDMKAEGAEASFGKLAPSFLDTLAKVDPEAYTNSIRPHFFQGLVSSGLPNVIEALTAAANAGDLDTIKNLLSNPQGGLSPWFNKLRDSVEAGAKATLDPDRQKFEQERTQFHTERQKAFQSDVQTGWNSENNRALAGALKPYLNLAFAKNWTQETKVSVAREITQTLLETLGSDKTYQSQMDAFWSQKSPDKTKILSFHKSKVDILAPKIVKQVLNARYPGFQNVKQAKVGVKPGVKSAPGAAQPAPGQAVPVKSKPLDTDIDWDKDPTRMLFITGKAYLRNGKFVSWSGKK